MFSATLKQQPIKLQTYSNCRYYIKNPMDAFETSFISSTELNYKGMSPSATLSQQS